MFLSSMPKPTTEDICIKIRRLIAGASLHRFIFYDASGFAIAGLVEKNRKSANGKNEIGRRKSFARHLSEEKRGDYFFVCEGAKAIAFYRNETNFEKFTAEKIILLSLRLHRRFCHHGKKNAVNPKQTGTKRGGAVRFRHRAAIGERYLRLSIRIFTTEKQRN